MGKSPATIIIARHGARLDAADKDWHLTSATPYDPPLSYGGWLQSRALGARIVDLLDNCDLDNNTQSQNSNPTDHHSPRSDRSSVDVTPDSSGRSSPQPTATATTTTNNTTPRRKRRTIIHTSPYLRCLQTAIAVCSSISQSHPPLHSPDCGTGGASAGPDANNANPTDSSSSPVPSPHTHRSLLRVDAFLGEWLCPDYFEDICPPPNSERLIADAKAELLRRSVNAVPEADVSHRPSTGYFPGGWGSASTSGLSDPEEKDQPGPLPTGNAIKQRYRAGSFDSMRPVYNQRTKGFLSKINTNLSSIPDGNPGSYVPPTPSYAIASSDPIPAGYVTHARNACVKVDYQWDSMRESQNWGNGGDYGEEWGAMHSRFRNGLEHMVDWYQDHNTTPVHPKQPLAEQEADDEDETETVLVLITHGAGCNAMVGALTGEPVLLDFSTASLTMAVRKNEARDRLDFDGVHEPVSRGQSHSDPSRLQEYDLKLTASVDHLRPQGNNPSQTGSSTLPSPVSLPSPTISYRHRAVSRSSQPQGPFIIGPSPAPTSNFQPWMTSRPSTAPRSKSGLWGSLANRGNAPTNPADDIVPNFGDSEPSTTADNARTEPKREESSSSSSSNIPQRALSQRGLWGSAPLNMDREAGVKRRWTVTERSI